MDWVPARVRDGADEGVLEELIREQARLYVVTGHAERLAGEDRYDPDDVTARERLKAVMDRLEELLDITWDRPWRVSVIGRNPRFPPQWRDAAWSTLTPAVAREAMTRWRRWYDDCLAGRHGHYRRRLRAWNLAHEVADIQRELVDAAAATWDVDTPRTRRPEFRRARHEVFALADPPQVPPPGQVPAADDDRPHPGQEELWETVVRHAGRLGEVLREFNRTAPKGCRLARRPEVGDDESGTADPWLEEFFNRYGPLVENGHGLYLW